MRAVFRRGEAGDPSSAEGEPGTEASGDGSGSGGGGGGESHPLRDLIERSQQTFEEWQKRVDERIRSAVESISPLAGLEKELRGIAQRVAEIEKRLEEKD